MQHVLLLSHMGRAAKQMWRPNTKHNKLARTSLATISSSAPLFNYSPLLRQDSIPTVNATLAAWHTHSRNLTGMLEAHRRAWGALQGPFLGGGDLSTAIQPSINAGTSTHTSNPCALHTHAQHTVCVPRIAHQCSCRRATTTLAVITTLAASNTTINDEEPQGSDSFLLLETP